MDHGGTYRAAGQLLGGRYRLESPAYATLGVSSWAAVDTWSGRGVTVHRLGPPQQLPPVSSGGWLERTDQRARQFGNLRHLPQLAVVSDVVHDVGEVWSVTEWTAARSLAETVRTSGPLPPDQVRAIAHELLDGLRAMHDINLTHGGVNPESVLLTPELRPVLVCAGVPGDEVAVPARLLGYRSPDQLNGMREDPAADVFAVGAVAYFAVEGRGPFDRGDDESATRYAVTSQPAPPPARAGAAAGPIMALLAQHRAARPSAAAALALFSPPTPYGGPSHGVPPYAASPYGASAAPPPSGYGGYGSHPGGVGQPMPAGGPSKSSRTPVYAAAVAAAVVVLVGIVLAVVLTRGGSSGTPTAASPSLPVATGTSTTPTPTPTPSRSRTPAPTRTPPSVTTTGADDYSPTLRREFLTSCVNASEGANEVCECALEEFEARYTQEEFVEFGLDPNSPEAQQALSSVVTLCSTTTDA